MPGLAGKMGIPLRQVIGWIAAKAALREKRPVSRFSRLDPRIRKESLRGLSEFLYLYKFQIKLQPTRPQATFRRNS